MDEAFKTERASVALPFTGERFTTAVGGEIEYEHVHRYLMARSLCRNKDVLDIASGEGYGAAFLAQVANKVVGVELDNSTVAHANCHYGRPNLEFICGDAREIPLSDQSVDIVVSFETLEHFSEHDRFLSEVNRVLRPNGALLISTPDRDIYSPSGVWNPFHVRELSRDEFVRLLSKHFARISLFRQITMIGSIIVPENGGAIGCLTAYEKSGYGDFKHVAGLPNSPFLVAYAFKSGESNSTADSSVLIETQGFERERAAHKEAIRGRDEAVRARDAALREVRAILDSTTWRMTYPLRVMASFAKRTLKPERTPG